MKQVGDEKELKAWFSKIKREHETLAPSFAETLVKAQSRNKGRTGSLRFSLAFVGMLLICFVLVSIIWFWQRENPVGSTQKITAPSPKTVVEERKNVPEDETQKRESPFQIRKPGQVSSQSQPNTAQRIAFRAEKISPKKKKAKSAQLLAKELLDWKSPTASLLQTPIQALLKPVRFETKVNQNNHEEKKNEN